MTVLEAIGLGALQGATEFLPVSSSGHLVVAQRLLGLRGPELAFDLLLHLATLLAVLAFLRRELGALLGSLFARGIGDDGPWTRRDLMLLVVSSLPTAAIGIAFHDAVETGVTLRGVGIRYLILTTLLLLSHGLRLRIKRDPDRIEAWEALAIGLVQGAAVFPGLSRSGSTISLALLLGIGAARGAKYSFFISLPAILGAALVHLRQGVSVLPGIGPSAAGFVAALLVGYLALVFVERLVEKGRFVRFAPYTLGMAVLCVLLHARGF